MMASRYLIVTISALLGMVMLPFSAVADVPVVSDMMVTDVTTASFSVIWASSEAAMADIEVFEDEDGTSPVSDVVVVSHPVSDSDVVDAIKTAAEDSGVMKVMVSGLQAGTTYYFQTRTTSKESGDATQEPAYAPLLSVKTELGTIRTNKYGEACYPFSNDVIIEACYLEDGETFADGSILIATVAGGNHPITAFVGDGVESPYALIDLNNVFSRESFENLDLEQGENLTLMNFRGLNGNSVVYHEVPLDIDLAEIRDSWSGLYTGRNMISFQLEPNDPEINEVLSPIMDHVISAWTQDSATSEWLSFVKDGPPSFNNLSSISAYTGMYLYVDDDISFEVDGDFGASSVSLTAGRNLVGYRSVETLSLSVAFEDIYDELISVWHFDADICEWLFFVKNGLPFLNTLERIEPGKSYVVYVENDCAW